MTRKPNPYQPDRCPSIDPHGDLQCGRRIHEDDQCQFGGIAWLKGGPPILSDRERADRLEAMCDRLAGELSDANVKFARIELLVDKWTRLNGWPSTVAAPNLRAILKGRP